MSLEPRRAPDRAATAAFPAVPGLPFLHGRPTSRAAEGAPLLLFLHGARDRGADLSLLLRWAPPTLYAAASERPLHFVAPQIPADTTWPQHRDAVLALLDHLIAREGVDPSRVLLAGFSLGAAGAWDLAAHHPERFAGLVAVSGRLPPGLDHAALATVPAWVVHGGRDDKVPLAEAEAGVAALRAEGGRVDWLVHPQGDHFIADAAYGDPRLHQWLLDRRRRSGIPRPAAA